MGIEPDAGGRLARICRETSDESIRETIRALIEDAPLTLELDDRGRAEIARRGRERGGSGAGASDGGFAALVNAMPGEMGAELLIALSAHVNALRLVREAESRGVIVLPAALRARLEAARRLVPSFLEPAEPLALRREERTA